jgi:hypothetical protein
MSDPSTHGSDGRSPDGKFRPGNKLGRGNPLAGRAAKIRAELLKMSTRKEVREICRKLIDGAKDGDLAFIRECPTCGAIANVYIEVTQDLTTAAKCVRCCGPRPMPSHPVKVYPAGLMEAL